MVTPRNQRYKRKINSKGDVPSHVQPTPEQSYESSTRDFYNRQPGFGILNDINVGALYRFGKENLSNLLTVPFKYRTDSLTGTFSAAQASKFDPLITAKNKVGQSTSTIEDIYAANALENVVRNRKMSASDLESFLNSSSRTVPAMFALQGAEMINDYLALPYFKSMVTKYAKLPKGPTSAYQRILEKFKG
jgi:hypothetical protein